MGADLLLSAIPAFEVTKEKTDRLKKIARAVKESDVDRDDIGCYVNDATDEEDRIRIGKVRRGLIRALNEVLDAMEGNRRDAVVWQPVGARYPLLFTGGMSWGESPSELSDPISLLWSFPAIIQQMEDFAVQDAGPFKITLRDPCEPEKRLPVQLAVNHGLEIRPQGYGNGSMLPGAGGPVYLDWSGDRLKLVIEPDINMEGDPLVLSLEEARESERVPDLSEEAIAKAEEAP